MRPPFPLAAIVGQEDLVEALMVCAVHPVVGGVLVRGERGTAKSTAVRALAPMLGGPLVDLPLGATLDRLVGTLDLRAAFEGEHRVESGLLRRADGGVLYVDEVNLLGDHLVDALLDAAASGEVTVERDGVSVVQEARFLLVGTMNPEEGELRPQLLDRFGLGVEIRGPRDVATRTQIVRRRMAYDASPSDFAREWQPAERALAERIAAARAIVGTVTIGERHLQRISTVCAQLELDGIRGDLVCAQAACALAALDGSDEVSETHVRRAAHLALRHRLRRDPLAPPPEGGRDGTIDDALQAAREEAPAGESAGARGSGPAGVARDDDGRGEWAGDDVRGRRGDAQPPGDDEPPGHDDAGGGPPPWAPDPDLAGSPPPPDAPAPELPPHLARPAPLPTRLADEALVIQRRGNRPRHVVPGGRAPSGTIAAVDARPAETDDPIALLPTVVASLLGDDRPRTPILGGGRSAILCLIVDTSGSMAAQRRLARVKGALEAALRRAYARRDLVAVVAFSGEGGRTLVKPGTPLEQAAAAARELPAGGRTPLAAGIAHAAQLLEDLERGHLAGRAKIAVLLTDGRAADPEGRARAALARVVAAADRTVVVDLEEGRVRLGLAQALANAAGADLTRLVRSAA
jgi:magnesium chelatase subunit D